VGRMNENGTLSIIDRAKNIFKLSQGEYIAPEFLETVYTRATFVAQCCVYGDSHKFQLVAVVVPEQEVVMKWAQQKGKKGDFSTLCADPELNKVILDEMTAVAKEAKLQGFEIVKAIWVEHELWTLENGLLTPTMKLKRQECKEKFMDQFNKLYQQLGEH